MNISKIFNWWAKNIGRVSIPKWAYKYYGLTLCDFCGQNLIGKSEQIIDYGWFKRIYDDKYKLGFLYAHKNKSDCDANRQLIQEKYNES